MDWDNSSKTCTPRSDRLHEGAIYRWEFKTHQWCSRIHYRNEDLTGDVWTAFDTLEWPFIKSVLNHFNRGKSVKQWTSICYTDILNNWFAMNWFTVFPVEQWTPEKISGMFIVSWPIRCEMKPQQITAKTATWSSHNLTRNNELAVSSSTNPHVYRYQMLNVFFFYFS